MSATNPPHNQDSWAPMPMRYGPSLGPAGTGPAPGPGAYPIPQQQYAPPHYALYPQQAPSAPSRPGTVLAGAIMTYIGAGIQILCGVLLAIASISPDFVRGFGQGFGLTVHASTLVVVGVAFALVGGILAVLAAQAARGRNAARLALTIIGGLVVLLELASVMTGRISDLLLIAWIAVAIALLWGGAANAWYRSPRS